MEKNEEVKGAGNSKAVPIKKCYLEFNSIDYGL